MSAHVLLTLLKELRKRDKMQGLLLLSILKCSASLEFYPMFGMN